MSENHPGPVGEMRDLLNRLKDLGGENWAEDLTNSILDENERKKLGEALRKFRKDEDPEG